jgi:thermitase
VGRKRGCLNLSVSFTGFLHISCAILLIFCGLCSIQGMAEQSPDVRLVVYSAQNESGGYEPVPPEVILPDNITYSLRCPELGFITVDTDPNKTEYITNELLNLPWVDEIERDALRISGTVQYDEKITNNSPDQWAYSRIGIHNVRKPTQNLSICTIAVIDTGADFDHPDIGKLIRGYDWVEQDSRPEDIDGHGTALSDIVSQIGGFISSPANNSTLSIIAERIGATNVSLPASHSALAITHATDAGAGIILMGYGGTEPSLAEERAITYAKEKGVLLIAPAGNEDSNTVHYPSDNFNVISVGSVAKTDGLSYFSNYGIYTELVAPGEDLISACTKNGYCMSSGTSFAAAQVAGVAGRIKNEYPGLTADEIRSILQTTATDLGRTGRDIYYGYGLLNAPDAMKAAEELRLQKTLKEFSSGNNFFEMKRNLGQKNSTLYDLTLNKGWNFVSIPAPLRSQKTCRDLFSKVNTDSHTIWTYRGVNSEWMPHNPDISPVPMEGILVFSDKLVSVPLVLETNRNSSKGVSPGWNLIGSPSLTEISACDLLTGSNSTWVSILQFNGTRQQYDPAIISGAQGTFADTRKIQPFSSFWIYMETNGTFIRSSAS